MTVNVTHEHIEALTVDTDAYTDGDVIGGLIDLNILAGGGGGGTVRQIRLVDEDNVGAALSLHFFSRKPTIIADDAPFEAALTVSDIIKRIAKEDILASEYLVLNNIGSVIKDDVNLSFSGELWLYVVANGSTPNYTNADALTVIVVAWKDA